MRSPRGTAARRFAPLGEHRHADAAWSPQRPSRSRWPRRSRRQPRRARRRARSVPAAAERRASSTNSDSTHIERMSARRSSAARSRAARGVGRSGRGRCSGPRRPSRRRRASLPSPRGLCNTSCSAGLGPSASCFGALPAPAGPSAMPERGTRWLPVAWRTGIDLSGQRRGDRDSAGEEADAASGRRARPGSSANAPARRAELPTWRSGLSSSRLVVAHVPGDVTGEPEPAQFLVPLGRAVCRPRNARSACFKVGRRGGAAPSWRRVAPSP